MFKSLGHTNMAFEWILFMQNNCNVRFDMNICYSSEKKQWQIHYFFNNKCEYLNKKNRSLLFIKQLCIFVGVWSGTRLLVPLTFQRYYVIRAILLFSALKVGNDNEILVKRNVTNEPPTVAEIFLLDNGLGSFLMLHSWINKVCRNVYMYLGITANRYCFSRHCWHSSCSWC